MVALVRETYGEAQRLLQASLPLYQQLNNDFWTWVLAALGIAACNLGNISQAQQCLSDVLRRATEVQNMMGLVFALPAMALLLVDQDKKERAVELYTLVSSNFPFVANSRWFEDVIGRRIAASAATLPPAVVAAAQAQGQVRALWPTAQELLVEVERQS
jgi:hypothetical protein